jgi:hypothetical protein
MQIQLDRLKAPANFASLYGTLPELRNPRKDEDVRLHAEWVFAGVPMVRTSTNGFYVIDAALYSTMVGRMMLCDLHAAISGSGSAFIWPVRSDVQSAQDAAAAAIKGWARVVWDQSSKTYKVEAASTEHDEPTWPFQDFDSLLDVALTNRILVDPENEIVQKILAKKKRGKK